MASQTASSAPRTHTHRPQVQARAAKARRASSAAASITKKPKKTAVKKSGAPFDVASVAVAAAVPNAAANTQASEAWTEARASSTENESSRLREQLLHVLVDHQRQEEEIVALRALARSLKDEVEQIHRQSRVSLASSPSAADPISSGERRRPHEFFKLDLQLEQLRAENARLRDELCDASEELEKLRTHVQHEVPPLKIAAVKARAELECVKSQLRDEQAHCDRLDEYKAADKSERSRGREAFLLQCRRRQQRINAKENVVNVGDSEADEESSVDENRCSVPQDAALAPASSASRDSLPASNSNSRSSSVTSSELRRSRRPSSLSSSQVHRDLSGLDRELHQLNAALDKIGTRESG